MHMLHTTLMTALLDILENIESCGYSGSDAWCLQFYCASTYAVVFLTNKH